jgi:hypothetical protein
VCWTRESGADDELGPPAGMSISERWKPADAARQFVPTVQPVRWAP